MCNTRCSHHATSWSRSLPTCGLQREALTMVRGRLLTRRTTRSSQPHTTRQQTTRRRRSRRTSLGEQVRDTLLFIGEHRDALLWVDMATCSSLRHRDVEIITFCSLLSLSSDEPSQHSLLSAIRAGWTWQHALLCVIVMLKSSLFVLFFPSLQMSLHNTPFSPPYALGGHRDMLFSEPSHHDGISNTCRQAASISITSKLCCKRRERDALASCMACTAHSPCSQCCALHDHS
jgi:hypothetical protein